MVLPDLGKDDAIHAFVYGLKPRLKGCESVVICFDRTYTEQSDDVGAKIGGKFGVCHTTSS